MNQDYLLDELVYCSICYFPHTKSRIDKDRGHNKKCDLLISYCMHIICNNCIKEMNYCVICNENTTFMPISSSIRSKLKRNPSELFARPLDIVMFQLNSSINLMEYYKDEINKYKKLLKSSRYEMAYLKKNKSVKTDKKAKTVLDFSNVDNSSVNSGRLTIPKDFNPYKKFYRK